MNRSSNPLLIITGAAGFIGCNVVRALNEKGYTNLLLIDRLGEDDRWKNLVGLQFNDLISPEVFLSKISNSRIYDRAVICIHLGACSSTIEKNADFLLENNCRFTQTVCKWSVAHHIRFVYASSAATYGDGCLGYTDDESALVKLKPLNMYGFSKQLFDLWAKRERLLSQIVGIKFFNVYGPHEEHKGQMSSLVNKAYHWISKTGQLELFKSYRAEYKDGQQKRDFVYIDDAVDVILYFSFNYKGGGIFNCGTGKARTWLDLAHAVFDSMKTPENIKFIEMPQELRNQYQYFTQSDNSKLLKAGYHRPFTELEEGVFAYIKYLSTSQ